MQQQRNEYRKLQSSNKATTTTSTSTTRNTTTTKPSSSSSSTSPSTSSSSPPKSKLTAQQIQRLNDIGFIFRPKRVKISWNERLEEPRAFRREYGHARVPMSHPTLGPWVHALRRDYKRYRMGYPGSKMTKERLTELQKLDFVFEVTENKKRSLGGCGDGGVGAGGVGDASGHKGAEKTSKQQTQTMVSSSELENTNDARLLRSNKRMLQNIQHEPLQHR